MGSLISLLLDNEQMPLIKTIKQILDDSFKGQEFTLKLTPSRRSPNSMCLLAMLIGPVTISWTDGPTKKEVEVALHKAAPGFFDEKIMTILNREITRGGDKNV